MPYMSNHLRPNGGPKAAFIMEQKSRNRDESRPSVKILAYDMKKEHKENLSHGNFILNKLNFNLNMFVVLILNEIVDK